MNPLQVVWDLDETLVSSRKLVHACGVPGSQIIHLGATAVEHVDDNVHFVTTVRPHATQLLQALRWLPGCHQHVSTTASPGYTSNVLELLDPQRKVFCGVATRQRSSGKYVEAALPAGADPSKRRTILIDNTASCHLPQPANGIKIADFADPWATRKIVLSGGKYAIGGTITVNAPDTPAMREVSWPLKIAALKGGQLGGGRRIDEQDEESMTLQERRTKIRRSQTRQGRKNTAAAAAAAAQLDVDDDRSVCGKLAIAPRGRALADLIAEARLAGAAALLVVDYEAATPSAVPDDIDFPVISVGARARHIFQNEWIGENFAGPATDITTAELVACESDAELLRLGALLALCWLLPDVRWALTPVVEEQRAIASMRTQTRRRGGASTPPK